MSLITYTGALGQVIEIDVLSDITDQEKLVLVLVRNADIIYLTGGEVKSGTTTTAQWVTEAATFANKIGTYQGQIFYQASGKKIPSAKISFEVDTTVVAMQTALDQQA